MKAIDKDKPFCYNGIAAKKRRKEKVKTATVKHTTVESCRVLFLSLYKERAMKKTNRKKIKGGVYRVAKRAMDAGIALVSLILLSPVLYVVAFAVRLSSCGDVVYYDTRVGLGGKPIRVMKFRTMYADANRHPERYMTEEELRIFERERKLDNDPRQTRVGRFLRRTSLDELPQLVNVVCGDISLVGNRPITEKELHRYYNDDERALLYEMRPGLTGYWQAYGRSSVTFSSGKRQEMDMLYARNASFLFDCRIFFRTFYAVFAAKGAK